MLSGIQGWSRRMRRPPTTDEAEEPELDIPAAIERYEARERLEQRRRESDAQRGRSDDRCPADRTASRAGDATSATLACPRTRRRRTPPTRTAAS